MDTPRTLAPGPRWQKKHRIDFDGTHENEAKEFDREVDLIVQDQSLPALLEKAIGFMLEMKEQVNAVMTRNHELLEENESQWEE
ncbi:hypothetical protein Aduo_001772 [Ancylostoma duodenale]